VKTELKPLIVFQRIEHQAVWSRRTREITAVSLYKVPHRGAFAVDRDDDFDGASVRNESE
jgi:hypothetical protein